MPDGERTCFGHAIARPPSPSGILYDFSLTLREQPVDGVNVTQMAPGANRRPIIVFTRLSAVI
jgi:hypothetical protein